MASKQGAKLFDITNKLLSVYLRVGDFMRHSVFMRRRELLIIGDDQHLIVKQLSQQMSRKWGVTVIGTRAPTSADQNNSHIQYLKLD
jgi:hypothetical protein